MKIIILAALMLTACEFGSPTKSNAEEIKNAGINEVESVYCPQSEKSLVFENDFWYTKDGDYVVLGGVIDTTNFNLIESTYIKKYNGEVMYKAKTNKNKKLTYVENSWVAEVCE